MARFPRIPCAKSSGPARCLFDDAGMEKTLEITTLRSNDERHRFERVQLLKTTVWWVAFLQIASRLARHVRARMESDEIGEPD